MLKAKIVVAVSLGLFSNFNDFAVAKPLKSADSSAGLGTPAPSTSFHFCCKTVPLSNVIFTFPSFRGPAGKIRALTGFLLHITVILGSDSFGRHGAKSSANIEKKILWPSALSSTSLRSQFFPAMALRTASSDGAPGAKVSLPAWELPAGGWLAAGISLTAGTTELTSSRTTINTFNGEPPEVAKY